MATRRKAAGAATNYEAGKEAALQNPVTLAAAVGALVTNLGILFGWAPEVIAAVGGITLNAAVVLRLLVLAIKDARTKLDADL